MPRQKLLSIIRAILEQPTAPFHEESVAAQIRALLAECPHVRVKQDAFGNLIAHYARGHHKAHYAFAAHMDHPGWVGGKFLGGVPAAYLENPRTKNFGAFAMWDLPAFQLRGDRLHSRACDDLIGCAAIVSMFHLLEESGAECACYGLFSRAEEVGFVGAIHLAKSRGLPRNTTVISLETSAERAPARMGDGAIVRVGDHTSIFDSDTTATIMQIANEAQIPVQRSLMSGGTCEATAYQLYGYTCAGLCVALGNYHNCGPRNRIAAEYVSLRDVSGLLDLCAAIARSRASSAESAVRLRRKLETNLRAYRAYFKDAPRK
jgi:endoglucanase